MLIPATDILKQSWTLYQKSWKKIWVYLLFLLVPTVALSALSTISLYLSEYIPSSTLASEIIILIVIAASLVFTLWASIAMARVLAAYLLGQEPRDWKTMFSESSNLILPVMIVSVLVFLIVFGGSLLLIIPGIIFTVWYSFTFYTVVFENKKGFESLSSSKSLVVGRWWAVLWRMLVPGVIFGLLGASVAYIIIGLVDLIPMSELAGAVVDRILNAAISLAFTPLTAGATLILYFNAKNNPIIAAPSKQQPPVQ